MAHGRAVYETAAAHERRASLDGGNEDEDASDSDGGACLNISGSSHILHALCPLKIGVTSYTHTGH